MKKKYANTTETTGIREGGARLIPLMPLVDHGSKNGLQYLIRTEIFILPTFDDCAFIVFITIFYIDF